MAKFDPFEIMSYETFLLGQYQINCQGLYFASGRYFIYCPEVTPDTEALNGENIHHWFQMNRLMSASIIIVNQIPEDAVKIDDQLSSSVPIDSGYLVTNSDLEYEIDLLIPKIFPDYKLVNSSPMALVFKEEVTDEGIAELRNIFKEAKFPVSLDFRSDLSMKDQSEKPRLNFFQTILTYRQAKSTLSTELLAAWEEDEDKWLQVRNQVITLNPGEKKFKPSSLASDQLRCLIDCSSGVPDNIRNYLTMYEQVCIVAPTKEKQESALQSLGVSEKELTELIRLNKVQLLFPRSIEQYDSRFLQLVFETNNNNIHLARTITTMTIMEMRSRNPFLFPAIPSEEKQVLLHAVDASIAKTTSDVELKKIIRNTISETGNAWVRYPNWLNQLDSSMLSHFGTSNLIRLMLEFHTKKDFKGVFDLCTPPVEWAAATGSILIPTTVGEYDTEPISSLIANVYSGTPSSDWVLQGRSHVNFAAENILTISQYLPVLELATAFNGTEISRFRNLIFDLANNQPVKENLMETIEAYNHFVKQFEKNKDNWATWNIKGFILGLIGKGITGVPLPSWLLGHVLKHTMKFGGKDPRVAKALDTIEASLQGGLPEAVLISKMRDKVKKKL